MSAVVGRTVTADKFVHLNRTMTILLSLRKKIKAHPIDKTAGEKSAILSSYCTETLLGIEN